MSGVNGISNNTSTINQTENADENFSETLENANAATTTSASQTQNTNSTTQQNAPTTPLQAANLPDPIVQPVKNDHSVIGLLTTRADFMDYHANFSNTDLLSHIHRDALRENNDDDNRVSSGYREDTMMIGAISDMLKEHGNPALTDSIKIMPSRYTSIIDLDEPAFSYSIFHPNGELNVDNIDKLFGIDKLNEAAEAREKFNRGEDGGINYSSYIADLRNAGSSYGNLFHRYARDIGVLPPEEEYTDNRGLNVWTQEEWETWKNSEDAAAFSDKYNDFKTFYSERLGEALERLNDAGVLVVLPAGDVLQDLDSTTNTDITYDIVANSSSAIMVGTTDNSGDVSIGSNTGSEIDFYANGEFIYDADLNMRMDEINPSSFVAASRVATLGTMLTATIPDNLSPNEIIQIIDDNSQSDTTLWYDTKGVLDYKSVDVGNIYSNFSTQSLFEKPVSSVTTALAVVDNGSVIIKEIRDTADADPLIRIGVADSRYNTMHYRVGDYYWGLKPNAVRDNEGGGALIQFDVLESHDGLSSEPPTKETGEIVVPIDIQKPVLSDSHRYWERQIDTYEDGREVIKIRYATTQTDDGKLKFVQSEVNGNQVTVSSPFWDETHTYTIPDGSHVYRDRDLPSFSALPSDAEREAFRSPSAAFNFLSDYTVYPPETVDQFGSDDLSWEEVRDTFLKNFNLDEDFGEPSPVLPNAFGASSTPITQTQNLNNNAQQNAPITPVQATSVESLPDPIIAPAADDTAVIAVFDSSFHLDHRNPDLLEFIHPDALRELNENPDAFIPVLDEGKPIQQSDIVDIHGTIVLNTLSDTLRQNADPDTLEQVKIMPVVIGSVPFPQLLDENGEINFEALDNSDFIQRFHDLAEAKEKFNRGEADGINYVTANVSAIIPAKEIYGYLVAIEAFSDIQNEDEKVLKIIEVGDKIIEALGEKYDAALDRLDAAGVTVVSGVGQSFEAGKPVDPVLDIHVGSKALAESNNGITVGAVTSNGDIAHYSYSGPLVNVYTNGDILDDRDSLVLAEPREGVSFSIPRISALATLMALENLSPGEIKQTIMDGSTTGFFDDKRIADVSKIYSNFSQSDSGFVSSTTLSMAKDQDGNVLIKETEHAPGADPVVRTGFIEAGSDGATFYYRATTGGFDSYVFQANKFDQTYDPVTGEASYTVGFLEQVYDQDENEVNDFGIFDGLPLDVQPDDGAPFSQASVWERRIDTYEDGREVVKTLYNSKDATGKLKLVQSEMDGNQVTLSSPFWDETYIYKVPEGSTVYPDLPSVSALSADKDLADLQTPHGAFDFLHGRTSYTPEIVDDVFGPQQPQQEESDLFAGLFNSKGATTANFVNQEGMVLSNAFGETSKPEVQAPVKPDTADLNLFERFSGDPILLVGGNYRDTVHLWIPSVTTWDWMYFGGPVLKGAPPSFSGLSPEFSVKSLPNIKALPNGQFGISHALVWPDVGKKFLHEVNPFVALNIITTDEVLLTDFAVDVLQNNDLDAFIAKHEDEWDKLKISIVPGVIGDPFKWVPAKKGGAAKLIEKVITEEKSIKLAPRFGAGVSIKLDTVFDLKTLLQDHTIKDVNGNDVKIEELPEMLPEETEDVLEGIGEVEERLPTALWDIFWGRMFDGTWNNDTSVLPSREELLEAAQEDGETIAKDIAEMFHAYDDWQKSVTADANELGQNVSQGLADSFIAFDNWLKDTTQGFKDWMSENTNNTSSDPLDNLSLSNKINYVLENQDGIDLETLQAEAQKTLDQWGEFTDVQKLTISSNSPYYEALGLEVPEDKDLFARAWEAILPSVYASTGDDGISGPPLTKPEAERLINELTGGNTVKKVRAAEQELSAFSERADIITQVFTPLDANSDSSNGAELSPEAKQALQSITLIHEELKEALSKTKDTYSKSKGEGLSGDGVRLIMQFSPYFNKDGKLDVRSETGDLPVGSLKELQKKFFEMLQQQQVNAKQAERKYGEGQALSQEVKFKLIQLETEIEDLSNSKHFDKLPPEMKEQIKSYLSIKSKLDSLDFKPGTKKESELEKILHYFDVEQKTLDDILDNNSKVIEGIKDQLDILNTNLDQETPAANDEALLDSITADIEKIKKEAQETESITNENYNALLESATDIKNILDKWKSDGEVPDHIPLELKNAIHNFFNNLPKTQKGAAETAAKVNSSVETLSEINEKIKILKKNKSLSPELEEWWEEYHATVENQKGQEALEERQVLDEERAELFPGTGAPGTQAPSLNPLGYALALVGGSILKPASVAAETFLNLGQTDLQDAVSGFEKTLKDIDQGIRDAGQGFLEFTQETQAATANFFKDVFGIKDDEAAEDGQAAPDTFFGLPIPVLPPIIPQIAAEPDNSQVQGPGDFSQVDFNNLAGSLPFMGTLATAMTNATGGNATYTGNMNLLERFDIDPTAGVVGLFGGKVTLPDRGESTHLWIPGADFTEDGTELSSMYFGGPILPGEGRIKHIPNIKALDDGSFGLSYAAVDPKIGDKYLEGARPFVAINVIASDKKVLEDLAAIFDEESGSGTFNDKMTAFIDNYGDRDDMDISLVPGLIGNPFDSASLKSLKWTKVADKFGEKFDTEPRVGVGAVIKLDNVANLESLLKDGVVVDKFGNEIPVEDLPDMLPEEIGTAVEVLKAIDENTPDELADLTFDYLFDTSPVGIGLDVITGEDPLMTREEMLAKIEELKEAAKEDGQTQAGWFLAYDAWLQDVTSDFNNWVNGTQNGSAGSNATVGTVREAAQGELLANWDKLSPSQKLLMHANSAYYRDLGIALGPLSATEEKILLQFNQTSSSGDFSIASFDDIEGFYEAVEKLEEQEEAEEKQAEQLEKVHETLKGLGPILTEIYNGERAPLGEGRTDITATVIQGVPEGFKKTTGFENYVTSVDKEGNVKLGHAAGLVDWAAFGKLLQEIAEGNANSGSGSTSGGSGPAGVSGLSEQDVALSSDLATVLLGVTSDGRLVLDTSVLEDNKLVDHISGLISGDEGPSWGSTEAVEALKKRILLSFENEGAVSDVDLDPAATALREALVLDEASLKDMTAEEFAERIDDGLKKKAQEERNAFWDALHGGEDPAKGFVYERPVNVAVAMDGLAALDGLQMGGVSVNMARGLFGVMAEARVQSASGTSANFSVNASSLGWQTFKGVEHTNALSSETLAAMKEAFSRISVPRQQLAWAFEVAQDKAGFDKQVADLDLEIRELQDRIDSARNSGGKWSDKTPEQHAAASAARTERREQMEALSAEREALQEKKEAYDEVWERKGAALSDLRALLGGMSSVILGLEGLLAANSEIVGTDAQIEHLLLGLDDLETNLVNEGLRMSASSGEFSAVRDGLIGQFMFGAAYQESEVTSFDFINADWQQRMSSPGYWAQMGKMETEMDHLKDFMVLVQEEHDKLEEIRKEWFMASPNKNLLNKYRDELAEIRTKQIGILEAAKAAAGDNPTYQAVLDIQIKDIEGRMSELSKSWKRETASNQRRQAHESLQEAKGTYKEYEKDFDALTQNYFAGDAERQDGQRVSALQKAVYSLLEAYMAGEDVSEDMGADVQALMDGLMVAMEKTDGKLARLNQALSGGDELRASMLDYALDKAAGQAMQAEMAGMFTTPGEGSEATTTYLDLLKEKQNLEAQVSGLDTQIDGFYGTKEGNYELTGQIYDASSYLSAQGSGAIDLLTVGDHRAALIEERQAAQAADPNLVLPPLEEALGLRLERDYLEKLPEGVAASARVRSLESQIANHIKYMDQQQKDGKYKNTGSGKARKNKDTNTLHGLQDQLVAAKKDVIGKEALLHQAVRNLIEHGGEGTLFNIFGDVQADETITPASALETVLAELTVISPQHAQLRVQLNTAQSRVAQAQHMVDNTSGSQRTTWRGELKKRQDSLEVVEGRLAPFEAELAKREELLAGREAFLAAQAEGQEPDAEQLQAWAATFAGLLERLEDKMIASQGTLRSNIGPVLPHLDDPATAQWHWDNIDDTANVTSSIEGAYVALLALQGLEQEAKSFLKNGLDAYQTETMTAWGVAEGERTKAKAQLSLIERQLVENHNWVDVKASYAQAEAEVDGLKLKLDGPEDDSAPAEIGTLAGLEADQHRELSLQGDRLNLLSGLKAVGEDTSEALAAELAAVKEKHATLTTQLNTAKGRLASAERALESWKDARSSTQRNSAVRTWTDEVKGRKESVAVYEARLAPVDAQLKELETVLAERGSPDAQLATLTAQVDKLIAVYEDEQAELEGKLAELANYPPEYLEGLDVWVDWRVSIAKSSSKITRAKYDAPLKEAEAFIAEVNALVADAGPRVAAQIAELKELKAGLSGQSTPEAALAWAENTLKAGITAGAEAIDTVETQISTTLSSELSGTQWEQEQVLANREKVAAHQQVLKDQEASMLAGLQGLKFESVDELYLHVHEAVALETEIKAAELEVKTLEQRAYDLSVDGRRTRADFTSEKQAWKGEKSATDAALAEAQAKLSGLQAKRVGNNDLAGSLNIQWGSVAHTVVALEGTLAGFARPETDARVEVHDFAGGLGDWRLVETLSTASGSKGGYTATAVEGGSVQISGDGNKVHANLAHKMDLSDLSGDEVTFTADFDFQGHASYSTARLLIKDGVTGQTLKQSLLANKEFGSFEGRQVTIDRSVLDGARDLSNVVVEVGLYDSHGANLGESLTLHNLSWEYTGDGSHGLKAAFDETLASHQDAVADEQSMYAGFVTNYEGKAAVLAETRVGLESDMAAATARYDAVHYTYADYESVYMQLQESEASATRFADLMEAHYTTLDNDPENDETRHFWLSPEAALQNIFEQSDAGASNEASADWAAFALGNFDTLTELRLGMADLGLEVSVKNSEAGRRIVTPAHDDPGSVFGDLAFLRHQLLNSGEGLSLQEMQAVETGLNLTILKAFADAGYFEAERVALEGHPKAAQIATLDEQLAETAYGVVHEDTGGKVHTDEFHRIIDVSDLQGDRLVVDFDLQGVAQDRNPSRAVIVVKNVEDGSTLLSTQINAPLAGTTDWQHTQLDLSALPHGKPLDLEGVDQVVIEVRTDFGAQVKGLTVSGHQHKLQGAERAKALADRDALIESSDNWGWQLDIAESRSELQAKRDELQAEYDAAPTEALAHELAHLDAQLTKALDDGIRAQVQELFADLGLEEGKPLGALDLRKTGMLSHLDTEVFVMDSELPPERRSDASSDEKFSNLNGFLLRNLEDGVNGADVLKGVQEILGGFGKGRADKNKKLVNYKAFQEFENISLTEGITDEITASRAHLDQSVARYGEKHKGLMGQRENVVKAQADPMVILERSIGQMDLRYMMPASAKLVATNDADDTTTEDTTSDDTETADTETESPLTLSTMSLADILANEDLQKLLGIENPIIISNSEETAQTATDNTVAA